VAPNPLLRSVVKTFGQYAPCRLKQNFFAAADDWGLYLFLALTF